MDPNSAYKSDRHRIWSVLFIFSSLLFIIALVFGIWAFSSRQDYKNNVSEKIIAAVKQNTQAIQAADASQYAEDAKIPLKTFVGPQAFGSVTIEYPKTWSAYVDETGTGSAEIDGYFQPDFVPSVSDQNSVFALQVQVQQQTYDQAVANFSSQVQQNQVTVKPFSPKKVPSVTGVLVTGQIQSNEQGIMAILPLRAYTLEIWTDSSSKYGADFTKYILPNFSFSP